MVDKPLTLTPAAFSVLLALSSGETHGYAVMADVQQVSAGELRLGPGPCTEPCSAWSPTAWCARPRARTRRRRTTRGGATAS